METMYICLILISLYICPSIEQITVSGLSSGAFAAVQFHIIYSENVQGAGIVAGGPFYCAEGNVEIAQTSCMADPSYISVDALIDATTYAYELDSIDNPNYLQDDKVYLYSGSQDSIVLPGVMQALLEYYQNYVTPANIITQFNITSEHAWVTNNFGNNCEWFGTPYINNCGYDTAGHLLQHLYGTLNPPQNFSSNNIISIDQANFIPSIYDTETAGLQSVAYYYLPTGCQSDASNCKYHVVFHGCEQTLDDINMTFIEHIGINNWAESNNIVTLYPQAKKTLLNPKGCWDWWGYTGEDYCTVEAAQMATVYSMINSLMSSLSNPI